MQNNFNKQKNIELKMLKMLIEICEKYKLRYFLVGGTCLGAVRHKGFIPWDDDIDVGMPREDYNKFLEIAQKELPAYIFLQNNITEPNYPVNFAKLRNSNTTMIGIRTRDMKINHGIYIDIFPLDGFPEIKIKQIISIVKNRIYMLSIGRELQIEEDKHTFLKTVMQKVAKIMYPNIKKTVQKRESFMQKFPYKNSRFVINYCGRWGNKEVIPKEWFGEGILMEFEDIKAIVPEKYHEYLTRLYGNYMTPPTPDKRNGHAGIIDTEKSYKEYIGSEENAI